MKLGFTTASHAVLSIMAGWAITVSAASAAATDPGVRAGVSVGDPLPGLTADQTTLFFLGQVNFAEKEQLGDGLGPRFNLDSCVGCHTFPTHGGSSPPVNPHDWASVSDGSKELAAKAEAVIRDICKNWRREEPSSLGSSPLMAGSCFSIA